MHKFVLRTLFALFLATSVSYADNCPICTERLEHTNNSLSPVVRVVVAPTLLSSDIGVTFLGELGTKNYRASGTFGGNFGLLSEQTRFKITGEYLSQKLKYSFYNGTTHRWVNQYAVGADFMYLIPECISWSSWLNSFNFNISYSHAFSRNLKSVICPVDTTLNMLPTLVRQIVGGNNIHGNLGTNLTPWDSGQLFVGLDYDYTVYNRNYAHKIRSSGLGGTVWLHQMLGESFGLDLGVEFRRPFNYYSAELKWSSPFTSGNLSIGVFAGYTNGKHFLPNNSMCGVSIDFAFGGQSLFNTCCSPCSADFCPCACSPCCSCSCDSNLIAWLVNPAVYMPTVLAIADQQFQYSPPPPSPCPTCPLCPICPICPPCVDPTSIPFAGNSELTPQEVFPFNASLNFFGTDLVYSLSPANANFAIDPLTGIITSGLNVVLSTEFTITATNSCGSTSETIWLENNPS